MVLLVLLLLRTLQHIQKLRIFRICTCTAPQHVTYPFLFFFIYFSTFFCICRGLSHYYFTSIRQCLLIIFYFILFVYFSKATDQTSNQGNKTSPLAFAPLRDCANSLDIIYLFILFLFFHYQIDLPMQSLYPFIISYSQ